VQGISSAKDTHIALTDTNEVPLNSRLVFSVKAITPESFSPDEKIEVATEDGAFHTTLSVSDGTMTLQDSKIALATVDLAKNFGPSAFGQLRFRPIGANGAFGDWQPLASLVRLPVLEALQCPRNTTQQCSLSGTNLFLLNAVASDPQFTQGMQVPDGFAGNVLQVPHPAGASLYVKLRDDPSAVNTVILPPKIEPQTAQIAPPPAAAPPPQASPQPVAPAPQPPAATPPTTGPSTDDAPPATATAPAQTAQPHN
jgi:hypothetical protein